MTTAQATNMDISDAAAPNNAAACFLKLHQCFPRPFGSHGPTHRTERLALARYDEARQCCDVAIAREPNNAKAYVRRAQAWISLQRTGHAVKGT